jgi:hypothetical protein
MSPLPYHPHLPEPWDTIFNFLFTLVFVSMAILAVVNLFWDNSWALAVGLIIVLIAIGVIVFVFVRLMTNKGKKKLLDIKE